MWRWLCASAAPSTKTGRRRSVRARAADVTTIAAPPSVTRQQSRTPNGSQTRGAAATSSSVSVVARPRALAPLRPLPRADRHPRELLGRRAVLVHVPRGRQRVGGDRQRRPVRRLPRVDLLDRGARAADRPLRRAVGDQRHVAEPCGDRGARVVDVGHRRRAADHGGVGVARPDAELLGQRHARPRQLRRRREDAVDVGDRQPRVGQRAQRRLGHDVGRRQPRQRLAHLRLGGAGDRDAGHAAPRRARRPGPARRSPPRRRATPTRTRAPTTTSSGATPTTGSSSGTPRRDRPATML